MSGYDLTFLNQCLEFEFWVWKEFQVGGMLSFEVYPCKLTQKISPLAESDGKLLVIGPKKKVGLRRDKMLN